MCVGGRIICVCGRWNYLCVGEGELFVCGGGVIICVWGRGDYLCVGEG